MVVDHDTGRLVWARPGRDEATVEAFFDDLGDDRAAALRLISTDAGSWITNVVDRRARNAIRCMDPFHVVAWVTDALDEVRRQTWNDARRAGQKTMAKQLKGAGIRCGRIPRTSPPTRKPSWPTSPPRTGGCTARTC